jgi:hypothetical protein
MGPEDPVGFVRGAGLSDEVTRRILAGTSDDLLRSVRSS